VSSGIPVTYFDNIDYEYEGPVVIVINSFQDGSIHNKSDAVSPAIRLGTDVPGNSKLVLI